MACEYSRIRCLETMSCLQDLLHRHAGEKRASRISSLLPRNNRAYLVPPNSGPSSLSPKSLFPVQSLGPLFPPRRHAPGSQVVVPEVSPSLPSLRRAACFPPKRALCSLRQTSAGKSTRTWPLRFQHARGTTLSARVHAALSPLVERGSHHFPQSRKNERIRQTAFSAYLRRPTDEKILWHRPSRYGNGPLTALDKNNGQDVYIFQGSGSMAGPSRHPNPRSVS